MDVSLMALTQHPADRDPERCLRELIAQARAAERHGFGAVVVGEHHFTPEEHYFNNFQVLSVVASETDAIDVGTCVSLLPLHHPGLVAERAVTLDAISGGRFVLGVGAGYRDLEFETLGIDRAERAGRLEEGIRVLRDLWRDGETSFRGEFFQLSDVAINPAPTRTGGIPIRVGGSAPAAVRRAARLGDAWLADPMLAGERLRKAVGCYDAALDGSPDGRPIRRDVFVAETTEEAIETAKPHIVGKFESLAEWGAIHELSGRTEDEKLAEVRNGQYVIGSPEHVVAEFEALRDEYGFDEVVARLQWPGMPHEETARAIDLLGEQVIPHVSGA